MKNKFKRDESKEKLNKDRKDKRKARRVMDRKGEEDDGRLQEFR